MFRVLIILSAATALVKRVVFSIEPTSVVASGNVVVAKFATCDGNFNEIAEQVLSKIPSRNEKVTYHHGHYLLHYIAENERLFFCITDNTCQRSRAFLFLNQIKRKFNSIGKKGFSKVLAHDMYQYSEDYSTIIIHKGELDELNSIVVRSSEEILGEKLLLIKNTEKLNYSTITYVGKEPEQVSVSNNGCENVENDNSDNTNSILENCHKNTDISILKVCNSNVSIPSRKTDIPAKYERYSAKVIIAVILLCLSIHVSDFIPFGQFIVLVLVIKFVLMK